MAGRVVTLCVAVTVVATGIVAWPSRSTTDRIVEPQVTVSAFLPEEVERVVVPDTLAAEVQRRPERSLVDPTEPEATVDQLATPSPPPSTPDVRRAPDGRRGPGSPTLDRQADGLLQSALDRQTPNFATSCGFSHELHDDPIVYPGQPGASHLHDFFGSRDTDANSTYGSLRSSETTCHILEDTAAYWTPALYDEGRKIDPEAAIAYYQSGPKDHTTVEAYPEDLRIIVKDDGAVSWWCAADGRRTVASSEPPKCRGDKHLVQRLDFPDCWDGVHVDTVDHMRHMVFARNGGCPASHPVPVPQLVLIVHYPGSDGGDITLAPPEDPSQPHADFLNAWHQPTLERLIRDCINAGANCELDPPES